MSSTSTAAPELLHPLSALTTGQLETNLSEPSYWYQGYCPVSGQLLRLPRSRLAEAIAQQLMQELAQLESTPLEGKMYGILIVVAPSGQQRVLKAFSGLFKGAGRVTGWVPPISGREQVALLEAVTLKRLEELKQELIRRQQIPERQAYAALSEKFTSQLQHLALYHQQRKQERQQQRQLLQNSLTGEDLTVTLGQLEEQSRQDGREKRQLKRLRDKSLEPLRQIIAQADAEMRSLKQQRKNLSRQLQAQMHAAYQLTNFAGQALTLEQLIPQGAIASGTGDCCAPKLLHYAASHQLQPLAMAEFWWGLDSYDGQKKAGEFYGACAERCQPLIGFLLSGLTPKLELTAPTLAVDDLTIVFEDEWLIAIDKPAGLLSVPGRYHDRQDSVTLRLQHLLPSRGEVKACHRLDQETSGILLLARHPQIHRQLSLQFQKRAVTKVYEAVLAGTIVQEAGMITLPLTADENRRPAQKVDWQQGRPSLTYFRVITSIKDCTRVELKPITGRSHQLRVHAADRQGLGVPILGDRLYGCQSGVNRLHLHARELSFQHPISGQLLHLQTKTPF